MGGGGGGGEENKEEFKPGLEPSISHLAEQCLNHETGFCRLFI